MIEIISPHTHHIAAGNLSLLDTLVITLKVYGCTAKVLEEVTPLFKEATHIYGKVGRALGEHLFEITPPSLLNRVIPKKG